MTDQKVTQCPECQTTFRITQKQLNSAGGSVRCGSCLCIFNAYQYRNSTNSKIQHEQAADATSKPHKEKKTEPLATQKPSTPSAVQHSNSTSKKHPQSMQASAAPTLLTLVNNAELIRETLEQTETKKKTHDKKTTVLKYAWTSLITLLIIMLLIQYIVFNKDTLALDLRYRDFYKTACQHLDCSLPPLFNLDQIKTLQLVVRQHPENTKALLIDAVIISETSHPQPFPLLALQFSDINGRAIAGRIVRPDEYLGGELAGTNDMPANQPIRLGLEIIDPGPDAVSYTLTFLLNE